MPHQKLNRVLNYVSLLVAFPVAAAIPGFARPSAGGSSGGVASLASDWIYHLTYGYEFPRDVTRALELAVYGT
jgi:hypothetical protein